MNIEEDMENSSQMLLLDLFSGAGGAAMGYYRAGFEVIGVDHVPQPRYPFAFIQADALEVLRRLIDGQAVEDSNGRVWRLGDFAIIHGSPKCQPYSRATKHLSSGDHPEQIDPLRELLEVAGLPYVIENVPGAPLVNPLVLCGTMFGLPLIKHRLFECNPPIWFPPHPCQCSHLFTNSRTGQGQLSAFGRGATAISVAGSIYLKSDGEIAMGINWMTKKQLSQAIPPAYTAWLGRQLIAALELP